MTAWIDQLPSVHHPWRWVVTFDYSQAMVEGIKQHIPSRERKWVPETKEWWFKKEQLQAVESLCFIHCGDVRYGEKRAQGAPEASQDTPVEAYATLHLLPSAPPEVVSAAYKALAKKVHPDRGGDKAMMQIINSAYQLIQQDYA